LFFCMSDCLLGFPSMPMFLYLSALMCVCLVVSLNVCLSTFLFVTHLSVCLFFVHASDCPSVQLLVCLCTYLYKVCLPVYMSTCLCLSFCLPFNLSVHLSLYSSPFSDCQSICLSPSPSAYMYPHLISIL